MFKISKNYIAIALYLILSLTIVLLTLKYLPDSKSISYPLESFPTYSDFSDNITVQEDSITLSASNQSGYFIDSPKICLPAGDFLFAIQYSSDSYNKVYFSANNDIYEELELAPGQPYLQFAHHLDIPCNNARFRFYYNGEGSITINGLYCMSTRPIYTDCLFYALLGFILITICLVLYLNRTLLGLTPKKVFSFLYLCIIGIICIPYQVFFHSGLYETGDFLFHLSRIEGIRDGLIEHQFPIVIFPYLANEYGTICTPYPKVFLYPYALLRLLGVSPVTTYKFADITISIAVILVFYLAAKAMFHDQKLALATATLYGLSPLHSSCFGSTNHFLGMGIASLFLILVIWGVYEIVTQKNPKWWILSFGMAGVLNSHVMMSILAVFYVAFIGILFISPLIKEKRIRYVLKAAGLSFLFSVYSLYSILDALCSNTLNTQALAWNSFAKEAYTLFSNPPHAFFIINLLCLCFVGICLCFLKTHDKDWKFAFANVLLASILVICSTRMIPYSVIENNPLLLTIFNHVQFPGRFYSLVTPTLIICMTYLFRQLPLFKKRSCQIAFGVISICLSIWGYFFCSSFSSSRILDHHVIGETAQDIANTDYLPVNVEPDWYSASYPKLSDEEAVVFSSYSKSGTRASGTYTCTKDNQYIEIPTFYYKGYHAYDSAGNELPIEVTDKYKIRIPLIKTSTEESFTLCFKVSLMHKVLAIFSALSFMIFLGYLIIRSSSARQSS